MPDDTNRLFVKTHVARDLLQTAGLFADVPKATWEYVVNGLQYVDPGMKPRVEVVARTEPVRFIRVSDVGRGMDWEGLKNYFVMHAENQDRAQGIHGRGYFGTGKSAAFGIADCLTVTTRKGGKQSKVRLTRHDIEKMSSGDDIPVEIIEREEQTDKPNGTVVEIDDIRFHVSEAQISNFVQRHLAGWRGAQVLVNGRECKVAKPPVARTYEFEPSEEDRKILGEVKLVVNVSRRFLDPRERGIAVYSRGVLHEIKPIEDDNYLFGQIDVPGIEDDDSPIPPFDVSRSLRLNPNNELVKALHKFIEQRIREVRNERKKESQEKQATEEAKKLEEHAKDIARVLNEDFARVGHNMPKVETDSSGRHDLCETEVGQTGRSVNGEGQGGQTIEREFTIPPPPGPEGRLESHDEEWKPERPTSPGDTGSNKADRPRDAERHGGAPQPLGGFGVQYEHMGKDADRSKYLRAERCILINLDHPQLETARGGGTVESPAFRRLAVEVAFSEYALALAFELAQQEGYFHELTDPIDAIRETLNRIAVAGARLYAG